MIRRIARIFIEIAGVIAGGVLVIALIVGWRLSTAPVEASFIRPYIEQEINRAGLGFTVSIAEGKLGWRKFRPVLDLHLRGVKILGTGGAPVATFQDATLGISLRGLLLGRLSPTELDVRHPQITVIRDAGDHFFLSTGPAGAATPSGDPQDIVKRLLDPPDDRDLLGRLRRVHLEDGQVVVDDQKLGIAWTAPDVDIDLDRNAVGVKARIDVSLALPQRTARFVGGANFMRSSGLTDLSLDVKNFDAAAIAPLNTILAPLAALAMPVDGLVHAGIDRSGSLVSANISLHGADGRLVLPDYYTDALALRSLDLTAHFENSPQHLVLDNFAVDLGDAKLAVKGTAAFNGPAVTVDAEADVTNIPLTRFDAIWPHGVAVGAHDWVIQHIPAGAIKTGTVHLATAGRVDDPKSFQAVTATGAFDYEGLEVHYLPPLPPIRNIAGHATFDSGRMDLTIDHGALGDIAVSEGALGITGLDQDEASIDIGLVLDGPLATALGLLDSKPFFYARKLGFDPKAASGHLNARTHFALPLIKDVTFAQVALGAKGKLDGIAVAGVVGQRAVTEGMVDLTVDKQGMSLVGNARLAGVPLSLDWQESFKDSDRIHSRIAFRGQVDDADRTALGLDVGDMATLHGKIGLTGTVAIDRGHGMTIDATADLAAADIAVDLLGLHKPAGEAGSAAASLAFVDNALRKVQRLQIDSASAKLTGSADFAADGAIAGAALSRVGGGGNDYAVTATLELGDPHAFAVSVKGVRFDASRLLQQQTVTTSSTPARSPKIDLTVALDHLRTAPNRELDAVAGTAMLTGSRLDRADLKAMAGAPLSLTYQPTGDSLILHLTANDAGTALADLGITGGVRGGTLQLDGKTTGGDGPRITRGTLDMRNFRLTKAPVIARLVNAISPTGFIDLLSGQGLAFDRLSSEADYADGKITFRNGRTVGALGISFEGDVDLDRSKIALKGTVVPADTLNRIIAAIPLIGDIVTGGDRGGFIGWTYSVGGSFEDPTVSVNPLSMFAPGFLRNLFFLGPSEPALKAPETPPKP